MRSEQAWHLGIIRTVTAVNVSDSNDCIYEYAIVSCNTSSFSQTNWSMFDVDESLIRMVKPFLVVKVLVEQAVGIIVTTLLLLLIVARVLLVTVKMDIMFYLIVKDVIVGVYSREFSKPGGGIGFLSELVRIVEPNGIIVFTCRPTHYENYCEIDLNEMINLFGTHVRNSMPKKMFLCFLIV